MLTSRVIIRNGMVKDGWITIQGKAGRGCQKERYV